MSLSWCLYGEIIPSDAGWRPAFKSAQASWRTIAASVSFDTKCSERDSGAGTLSVSKNTTGRLGKSVSSIQLPTKAEKSVKISQIKFQLLSLHMYTPYFRSVLFPLSSPRPK